MTSVAIFWWIWWSKTFLYSSYIPRDKRSMVKFTFFLTAANGEIYIFILVKCCLVRSLCAHAWCSWEGQRIVELFLLNTCSVGHVLQFFRCAQCSKISFGVQTSKDQCFSKLMCLVQQDSRWKYKHCLERTRYTPTVARVYMRREGVPVPVLMQNNRKKTKSGGLKR